MAKRFKTKHKRKNKLIIITLLLTILFTSLKSYKFFLNKYLNNNKKNQKFINYLLTDTNIKKTDNWELLNINTTNNILSNSLSDIISIKEKDLYSNKDEVYEYEKLSTITEHVEDPNPTLEDSPLVYIYNTHQLENYATSFLTDYNIKPNVLMASYLLKEKLNKEGIKTIVEESDITNFLRTNNWQYQYSYKASRYYVEESIKQYPSLKYLIDLHRDSIAKEKTTLTIDNKNYAKIIFVIGLENPNYQANYDLVNDLHNKINAKINGLSKGILKKGGKGVNGIYNQDLSPNAILIEMGGVENNIEEVANTIDIVALSLKEYVKEHIS